MLKEWFKLLTASLPGVTLSAGIMKGMSSNRWSAETLLRGTAAVSLQPVGLLSKEQLEDDKQLLAALQATLSFEFMKK